MCNIERSGEGLGTRLILSPSLGVSLYSQPPWLFPSLPSLPSSLPPSFPPTIQVSWQSYVLITILLTCVWGLLSAVVGLTCYHDARSALIQIDQSEHRLRECAHNASLALYLENVFLVCLHCLVNGPYGLQATRLFPC